MSKDGLKVYIKQQSFCIAKETIDRMKNFKGWGKYFQIIDLARGQCYNTKCYTEYKRELQKTIAGHITNTNILKDEQHMCLDISYKTLKWPSDV